MNILTSVPVRVNGPDSIAPRLDDIKTRIERRAYQMFVERGCVPGRDLDDWLNAERELIVKLSPVVSAEGEDIFVEMMLPEIDLPNLTLHVSPRHFVVSSDPGEQGLQLCEVIDLPLDVCLDGID